jgi:hypothetical protein
MKMAFQLIDVDAISPPCSRVDQWLMEVGDGKTTLAFDDWFAGRIDAVARKMAECDGQARALRFIQGPVEFELAHGGCYMVSHSQKGTRHFRCILDGHFPLISFYRPGASERFPWITLARVFVADELRSLKRVA